MIQPNDAESDAGKQPHKSEKPMGTNGASHPVPDHLKPFCFQPGQSGNPDGRPKGTVSIRKRLREILEKEPAKFEKVCRAFIRQAIKGNPGYAKELIETIDGKVSQHVDLTGSLTFADVMKLGAEYGREREGATQGGGLRDSGEV